MSSSSSLMANPVKQSSLGRDAQLCFHCGEAIIDENYPVEINSRSESFCCPACAAVAQLIHNQGFEQYYLRRDSYSLRPDAVQQDFSWWNIDEIQRDFVQRTEQDHIAQLQIEGIHCAACCWLIEQQLKKIPGISECQVSLHQQKAQVNFNPERVKVSDIGSAIYQLGYAAKPWQEDQRYNNWERQRKRLLKQLGVAGLGMMQVGMCAIGMYAGDFQGMEEWLRRLLQVYSMIVTAFVLIYSCQDFFRSAWRGLKHKTPGMDLPVSLAIGIAFFASVYNTANYHSEVYFDAVCMFAFFLLLARYIELLSRADAVKTRQLLPDYCLLANDDGEFIQTSRKALRPNDIILIKAGDTIAADGTIIEGRSLFDESAFSGESVPMDKTIGDQIFAGSINQGSVIKLQVTALEQNTRLAQINQLLDNAQSQKPRISQLADRLSVWFVSMVLLLAVATVIGWTMAGADPSFTFVTVLAVLVVSCPCALSLATPVALASSGFFLKRHGLAIRSHLFLETLPDVDHIVFDKTGTLTKAQLTIQKLICTGDMDQQKALSLIATLEQNSNHPIAKVFAEYEPLQEVTDIQEVPSQGLMARYNHQTYKFGKPDFAAKHQALPDELGRWLALSSDEGVIAWLDIRDETKPEAKQLIDDLKSSFPLTLLSGDQPQACNSVAKELGIDNVLAEQSPEDKLAYIQSLQKNGKTVLMVGDGINDAPVLAQANVSIAAAEANDLSKSRADAALLGNLDSIVLGLAHAKKTRTIIRENLSWALLYNFSAIPLAIAGWVPPWLAAIGMSASSVFVCLNATRLSRAGNKKQNSASVQLKQTLQGG